MQNATQWDFGTLFNLSLIFYLLQNNPLYSTFKPVLEYENVMCAHGFSSVNKANANFKKDYCYGATTLLFESHTLIWRPLCTLYLPLCNVHQKVPITALTTRCEQSGERTCSAYFIIFTPEILISKLNVLI